MRPIGLDTPETKRLRGRPLTDKERRFVEAFFGTAAGNGTKAAIMAGYTKNSARVTASRLLTKANIHTALAARIKRQEDRNIAGADERDAILSNIARGKNSMATVGDQIRAISELNRVSGRRSVNVNVKSKGKLTLEEALGASREGDE